MQRALSRAPDKVVKRFLTLLATGGERERQATRILRAVEREYGPLQQQALSAGLQVLKDFDARPWLREIDVPTCWIGGDSDPLVSARTLEWAAGQMAHACCDRVAGAGHIPFLTHPEAVAAVLARLSEEWLD
jgi:pimeloyl-[acyl-carrier protein] methyl ester esterase